MNSAGDELHPNWLALTTLPLQLKCFVRAGHVEPAPPPINVTKHEINGLDGDEVQMFYKEVLETPATRPAFRPTLKKSNESRRSVQLPFDKSRFFRLAIGNKVEEMSQMHITDKQLNACDGYGWTALMMAACDGCKDAVSWLLHNGAQTDVRDKSGNTALALAKLKGHTEVVQILETSPSPTEDDTQGEIETTMPFHCSVCKRNYKETPWKIHQTSTVHQFNMKAFPSHKLVKFNISAKNRGLQLMVKQGWDREHGLGPTQSGRLYPVKTVLRKLRSGLGIEQPPAKVTHFKEFDPNATRRKDPGPQQRRSRQDMQREKLRDWKRNRRLRNELH
ncbi:G patch domain and ankyrin repeat-containing protein 1 homolog [Drosophila subobscura]|uniref:G patch domain and ankyrin repeat-containing protein 1 homolog n=1 Tax=Drosophila subobscura TaxID=7241 RepID=UPI00155AFBBC|nr:G patch domain and ankyrin repeat-containing protein 1 homolog [Drosophila subobscura]